MGAYRIVLADDHALVRDGIRRIIAGFPDFEIVGEASDGYQLLKLLKTLSTDMVILDLSMPDLHGVDVLREIKRSHPEVRVLILTMHKSKEYLRQSLAAGADGFLLKEDAHDELYRAIRKIQREGLYISPLILDEAAEMLVQGCRGTLLREDPLTERELQVLRMVADGKTSDEIAKILHISPSTVRNHRANIRRKLNVKNNAELLKCAMERGYILATK